MQSFAANNNHLIHYWVDFGTESIDFTLGQAKIYAAFPNARMIVSPSKLKKGNIQAQSIYLKQFIDQFPPNTIHICHLSFHSSQTKRFVITQINDQFLVGPDNGFFHLTIGNELHKSFILPVDKFKNNSLTEVYLPGIKMAMEGDFDLANIFKAYDNRMLGKDYSFENYGHNIGNEPLLSFVNKIEDGVHDYVTNRLVGKRYL